MNSPLFRTQCRRALLVIALVPLLARAEETIDSVQQAATEWARIRIETVRLDTEWTAQRRLLESSIGALKERIGFLEERRDALAAKTAADRRTAAELNDKNTAAGRTMDAVTAQLDLFSGQLARLRPWLPPRLAQALELPYRTLADSATSPSERAQLIVRVLNRCAQFNKTITFAEEVMDPEGSATPRMMEVLYWGLSHGYALDRSGGKAYFGHPTAPGWAWEPLPGQGGHVAQLIAIHQDKADPEFVEVPVRVSSFPAEPKP